jgi:hypothetical protein
MSDTEIIQQFQRSIDAITTSLQLSTRHHKGSIESWKTKFHGKRISSKAGEVLGVVDVHLDPTNHVFVSVGGSTFPVGHLQAMVDAGSLSVVDS